MTEIIALISGKGGSGKTATALALGYLAADLGVKTLLVDADAGTHGMTYFFVDRLLGPRRQRSLIGPPASEPELIRISEKLDFLPSVPSISARTFDPAHPALPQHIKSEIGSLQDEYELVLIDCQAGVGAATAAVLQTSAVALVVTEADPISIWAVNDLVDELRADLPATVRGLVNKTMKEEQAYFDALVDITQRVRYVGQLPFDLNIRRAFFRREVPVEITDPSPFVLSLAALMPKLSDCLKGASAEFDRWQVERQVAELEGQFASLSHQRELMLNRVPPTSYSRWSELYFSMRPVAAMFAVVCLLTAGTLMYRERTFDWWFPFILMGLASLATLLLAGSFLAWRARLFDRTSFPYYTDHSERREQFDRLREIESRIAEVEVALESARSQLGSADSGSAAPDRSRSE